MKHPIIIYAFFVFFLLSCKSQKDVSRSSINQTRGESLVSIVDTMQTHLEASHKVDAAKQEDRLEYSKTTEFGNDNNVESITERYLLLFSKLDFKSQLEQIKREDFRYNATVSVIDTTSMVVDEQLSEVSDNRLVQGHEWLYIIIGVLIFITLAIIYLKKRLL